VSCEEPHGYEVYASFELPDFSYKSEDYAFEQASIGCEARFKAYVGIEYVLSTMSVDILFPLEESWKDGDRLVTCSLREESAMKVTGSAKGSRR